MKRREWTRLERTAIAAVEEAFEEDEEGLIFTTTGVFGATTGFTAVSAIAEDCLVQWLSIELLYAVRLCTPTAQIQLLKLCPALILCISAGASLSPFALFFWWAANFSRILGAKRLMLCDTPEVYFGLRAMFSCLNLGSLYWLFSIHVHPEYQRP